MEDKKSEVRLSAKECPRVEVLEEVRRAKEPWDLEAVMAAP